MFFLGYWRNPDATRAKFTADPQDSWCRTGDTAVMDEDGYLWYLGRSDDMFKAAGYRIGPSEIENCLVKHPAVANAAVVPKPDRERGAVGPGVRRRHLGQHLDLVEQALARYDDLVNGKEEPIDVSKVDVSMNGIELQDREFIAAIREGREPNSSVAP